MKLAENQKPLAAIRLAPEELADKSSPVLFAAKELRYYLDRMTAASVALVDAPVADTPSALLLGKAAELDTADLGPDGFRIETSGDRIRIAGGKRGVVYGVYEFLERLGCRFFTHNCEKIPVLPDLEVPEIHFTGKPAFEYREHNYADAVQNPRFSAKCRFNGSTHHIPEQMGGSISYALFVHTFEKLIPVAEFGETHPEYFALVDGQRLLLSGGRTQLCLSNPDVLRLVIERTRAVLRQHPEAGIISISQNDWWGGCQCDVCRKTDAAEGSPAGTLLRFVNAVAKALEPEFPQVVFDTLAYTYTRPAPRLARNRHNVCVRLCSIECCFAHPFESCDDPDRAVIRPDGSRSSFISDLRDWGKICDRMYIWDYTTCFAHYPTPHPNWRVLQPNAQAMAKNNVKGVFEQACGASRGGVDFNELRLYLISKLLWDPNCDIARHRREFMDFYYGAAADALDEYLNLVCDTVEKLDIHVGFNDNPEKAFLSEEMLDKYDALFDKAATAVAGDPLRLWRVEKARLSIRWVRLKRAAMLRGERDPVAINCFFTDWRAFNLSRIDEWCNLETTHRALLDGHWRGVSYFDHWTDEEREFL